MTNEVFHGCSFSSVSRNSRSPESERHEHRWLRLTYVEFLQAVGKFFPPVFSQPDRRVEIRVDHEAGSSGGPEVQQVQITVILLGAQYGGKLPR